MKLYIVTSGEYSGYGIDKVFLNKNKAEEFCRLNANQWSEPRVEEYENSDDDFEIGEHSIKKYLSISYTTLNYSNEESIDVSLAEDNTLNEPNLNDYPYNYKKYSYYGWRNEHDIVINKLVDDDYILDTNNKKALEDKYLKICRDYLAKAKSLHELEGFAYDKINDILF